MNIQSINSKHITESKEWLDFVKHYFMDVIMQHPANQTALPDHKGIVIYQIAQNDMQILIDNFKFILSHSDKISDDFLISSIDLTLADFLKQSQYLPGLNLESKEKNIRDLIYDMQLAQPPNSNSKRAWRNSLGNIIGGGDVYEIAINTKKPSKEMLLILNIQIPRLISFLIQRELILRLKKDPYQILKKLNIKIENKDLFLDSLNNILTII